MHFTNDEEAIRLANDTSYGLTQGFGRRMQIVFRMSPAEFELVWCGSTLGESAPSSCRSAA